MCNHLELARQSILEPAELGEVELEKVLSQILCNKVDNADLYFQAITHESWVLEDGIVKKGLYSFKHGVGVRAISGGKTGFAYSSDIVLPALEQAATAAKTIAIKSGSNTIKAWHKVQRQSSLYKPINPSLSLSDEAKITLLRQVDKETKKQHSSVSQVIASLFSTHEIILIVASDGTFAADVRPLVRLNVSVIVEKSGRREKSSQGGGGRGTYMLFFTKDKALKIARNAVKQALINLEAQSAPAGNMPVVLGPGWPGVLLHEAIGHGLEGDFIRKKSSAFSGQMGEKIASSLCTIVDNGTLPNKRGSLNIDDEGTPTQCTTLIEEGILTAYMQDKLNARLMNMKSTGNGRRESYACLPIPRMTNTYMLPGPHDPNEILASVDKGIYAVNFSGGQVDITSGKFVFDTSEAYLIEKGKVTRPIKGATLIGNGPDILTNVSMVGNDLALDQGVGVCGKEGQSVPVGVGQPTLLIDHITVGGTQN